MRASVCGTPTVPALAHDVDNLERHIELYGSAIVQSPSVWGQARLTKHRQEFEDMMYAELGNFSFSLQGSMARSDQAFFSEAFALSMAAASASGTGTGATTSTSSAAAPPATNTTSTGSPQSILTSLNTSINPSAALNINTQPGSTTAPSSSAPSSPTPTAAQSLASMPGTLSNFTRTPTGTVTGPGYSFQNGSVITVEPEIYLAQKARYIHYLQELRRTNEGDDTVDSPGYALNLIRFPVSILPGKCTDKGHGAEVSMTLTPHLSNDLLPTTFRNLVINDLVQQLAYPITQFINNPNNAIYLDDSRASASSGAIFSDVGGLFRFIDNELDNLFPNFATIDFAAIDTIEKADDAKKKLEQLRYSFIQSQTTLQKIRYTLSLQRIFATPDWDWVDDVLRHGRETDKILYEYAKQLDDIRKLPELMKPPAPAIPQAVSTKHAPPKGRETTGVDEGPTGQKLALDLASIKIQALVKTQSGVRDRTVKKARQAATLNANAIVPATKSRRASLPFPPSQMVEIYGFEYIYEFSQETYRGLRNERFTKPCTDSANIYIHLPDVQGQLQEELSGVYKLLSNCNNRSLWEECKPETLAAAIRTNQIDIIRCTRQNFATRLTEKAGTGIRPLVVALAWAYVVESALLTEQLVQDMKEAAAAKGCACSPGCWLDYYLPEPSEAACQAFNAYVACRWPIHVFALDPVAQQQNLADTFSARRELQFAMSLAFVTGNLSASNMMTYARRIEVDMATIDINNTCVGFSHGDNTFGWRFYPRYQTPDIESNGKVFFRDLLIGGPKKNALLRERHLEPGNRECVAVVMMPSFVPYADLTVTSNWFSLTNPKAKLLDAECAMRLSKAVKTIETCGPNVRDAQCYRDGELPRLLEKSKQLTQRLPYQSTTVQIPYENTLGGFAMFNTGLTDLAPELTGWYGSPSIDPCNWTTIFLVGNHFSVHQTRVIAGGREIPQGLSNSTAGPGTSEMLSREVIKVMIPPNPLLVGDANHKFVDVHLATPYGISQHLLIPVCSMASQMTCPTPPAPIPVPNYGVTLPALPAQTIPPNPNGTPGITTPASPAGGTGGAPAGGTGGAPAGGTGGAPAGGTSGAPPVSPNSTNTSLTSGLPYSSSYFWMNQPTAPILPTIPLSNRLPVSPSLVPNIPASPGIAPTFGVTVPALPTRTIPPNQNGAPGSPTPANPAGVKGGTPLANPSSTTPSLGSPAASPPSVLINPGLPDMTPSVPPEMPSHLVPK